MKHSSIQTKSVSSIVSGACLSHDHSNHIHKLNESYNNNKGKIQRKKLKD